MTEMLHTADASDTTTIRSGPAGYHRAEYWLIQRARRAIRQGRQTDKLGKDCVAPGVYGLALGMRERSLATGRLSVGRVSMHVPSVDDQARSRIDQQ